MAISRDQKAVVLEDLRDKFQRSKGVVFAQYRGMTVNDLYEMRKALRASKVDYKVAKKTLVRIAAQEQGYEIPKEVMEGPVGVAFGFDDEIIAAQKMSEFSKKFENLKLMGGVMEGKVINASMVKQLASIPPREVLLAQLMGAMKGPISGFATVLNGVVAGFVRVVDGYREKKADGTPVVAAEPTAPAAAEPEVTPEPEAAPAAEETPSEETAPVESTEA